MARTEPLPRKVDGLSVEVLGDEIVVVDPTTLQAHALSGLTAEVWRGIEAGTWPEAADEDLDVAVQQLVVLGLVQAHGMSRRLLLQRAGTVALAGAVITIGLPSMHAAASGHLTSANPSLRLPRATQLRLSTVGTPTPTGSSTLYVLTNGNYTVVDGPKLLAAGVVTFANGNTDWPTGTYRASYSGDANYLPGDTAPFTV